MNKQSAINLVKSTFENPYDKDRFLNFSRNLFHSFEPATFIYRGNYIPDAYKKQIKTLERIGKFEDRDRNKIDILAVCLYQDSTLERARTLQRNFISWYLNGSRGDVTKDAALVAFYVEGSKDWRLSLVKMEYRLGKSDSGRLKTFTELTPAKRFSFLVGEYENTHTAQKQLLPSLLNEEYPPSLSDLEKIFNVEVVTKEFFEKYKQLFLDTKEALDEIIKATPQIQSDFKDKNIDTVDFTKKLLGQIVFLYFLQKKGWFGVSRDDNWGTGPKEFLRLLFEKQVIDYKNYFNDILEPLFYEALAIERPDDFYSRFDCKIPFLNGGLFDPLNNYDWVHTDIHLPNHLFSNDNPTKEGDRGTGILDVFDRYNFTVKEDEPLEREVAVDPEMLGKVFENLLEVKDRKSKGTYYTPREIVHYMCQESLVNYLATELDGKANKEDIETLVQIGEAAVEHDTRVTEMGEETETYSYKLPASVRKNAQKIDEALANIRVCDPAVGSGAFLVGMMTEIIRVRNTISSYFVDGDRSIYTFKHHAIQNSLYGVDIDPGATEIAKLRLWLSLIVDEQDIKKIKPLPNLDYKIMQGNSLLEEFEGIKLFDEELFIKSAFDNTAQIEDLKAKISELQREFMELYKNNQLQSPRAKQIDAELQKYNKTLKKLTETPKPKTELVGLFDHQSEAKAKAKELKHLQKDFFLTSHKKEKDQIKKRIESLTWELIEATLREQGKASLLREIEKFKKTNIKPFFLWKLNFSEVFESKGGFDVIIANPPYIRVQSIDKSTKDAYKEKFIAATNNYDIYILFDELAISLLKDRGQLTFIQSHKFFSADYGIGIRSLLGKGSYVHKIVDFGANQMFDTATTYTCLLFCQKTQNPSFDYVCFKGINISNLFTDYANNIQNSLVSVVKLKNTYLEADGWFFGTYEEVELYKKLESQAEKLDKFADSTFQGVVTSADPIYILEGRGNRLFSKFLEKDVDLEGEFLKPLLKGSDITRYTNTTNRNWLIFPYQMTDEGMQLIQQEVFSSKYPKTWNYLESCEKKLRQRESGKMNHEAWYAYVYPKNLDQFEKSKILIQVLAKAAAMTIDEEGKYYFVGGGNAGGYGLTIKQDSELSLKYLLALLNSSTLDFYLQHHSSNFQNGYFSYAKRFLQRIPLKVAEDSQQKEIEKLVDAILSLNHNGYKKESSKKIERQIDEMVYKLYDLSPEEIAIIEDQT